MKKIRLQLDALAVESFETTAAEKAKGTVFGEECSCLTDCTCPGCPTCDNTCPLSCNGTCNEFTCGGDDTCLDSPCQTYPNQTCGCTDGKYAVCGEA